MRKLCCGGQRSGLREGHDDEVGSIEPFVFHEVRDEGNGLDGFPQTHLVGQDPIQIIVVERNQPFQTFNLTDKEETQRRLWSGAVSRRQRHPAA